jgi:hypothetical protein
MIEPPTCWVPIPPLKLPCENHFCQIKYLPLSLAWAKTGHTFQGQSAGQGCTIPCIIVQPGNKQWKECVLDHLICFYHEQQMSVLR